MEVVYKLWETSWDDDAVVRDVGARAFVDPARVHPIEHAGRYFAVRTLRDSGRPGGTFRDLAGRLLSARLVGTPEQIADQLEAWI